MSIMKVVIMRKKVKMKVWNWVIL